MLKNASWNESAAACRWLGFGIALELGSLAQI